VSDAQRQPTPAPTSARPAEPTQVRSAADAAAWLRHRATEFITHAHDEPSPIHATALRKAAATLNALAVAVDHEGHDDTAAAAALLHLAGDYRQAHLADRRDPDFEDYQVVCGHLADTLAEVGGQLRRAAAAERTRRAPAVAHPHMTRRNL
jgi:hypothetical protein